jgi:hypothetical protein
MFDCIAECDQTEWQFVKKNITTKWLIYLYIEKFEDTKGIIGNRKSKKECQCNGQQKMDNRTNNDIQNTTQIEQHELH